MDEDLTFNEINVASEKKNDFIFRTSYYRCRKTR